MSHTCWLVRSLTDEVGATMTAMPSRAMGVPSAPAPASESFRSREAMPMSQVPSSAMFTPVVESDCCTSTVTWGLADWKASASFSMTGVTEEDPATTTFPLAPLEAKGAAASSMAM